MAVEGDGRMQRRDGLLGIMGSAPLRPSSFPYGRTVHMRRQMRLAGGMPLKLSGWMWRWCLAGSGAGASPVVHVAIVPAYNVGGGGSVRRSRSTATERTICMGDRRSGEVGRRVNNDARAGAGALDLGPRGAEGRGAAAVFNRTHTRLTARAGTGRGVFLRPYRCCWVKWHRPEHRRLTQAPLRRSSVLEERRSKKQRRVSSEARGVPTAALLGLTTKRTGEHDAPPARRMCVCWNARIRKGRRAAEDSALADVSGGFSGSVCGVGGGAVWA